MSPKWEEAMRLNREVKGPRSEAKRREWLQWKKEQKMVDRIIDEALAPIITDMREHEIHSLLGRIENTILLRFRVCQTYGQAMEYRNAN